VYFSVCCRVRHDLVASDHPSLVGRHVEDSARHCVAVRVAACVAICVPVCVAVYVAVCVSVCVAE